MKRKASSGRPSCLREPWYGANVPESPLRSSRSGIQGHENGPEDEPQGHQAHAHHGRTGGFREGVHVTGLLFHQHGREHQGEGRAQTGDGQLEAHGEGHRPAFEPFGDAARNGRAGNFTAQAEEHDAHIGRL